MGTRTDSTTKLLRDMFLWCRASNESIIRKADTDDCKMCNKCVLIEDNRNYVIFMFKFDTEALQYKFDVRRELMKGVQLIENITFIGFCD